MAIEKESSRLDNLLHIMDASISNSLSTTNASNYVENDKKVGKFYSSGIESILKLRDITLHSIMTDSKRKEYCNGVKYELNEHLKEYTYNIEY